MSDKLYAIKVTGGYVGCDRSGEVDAEVTVPRLADAMHFCGDTEGLEDAFTYASFMSARSPAVVEVLVTYAEGPVAPDPEAGAGDEDGDGPGEG
jgi:hypothetical protein